MQTSKRLAVLGFLIAILGLLTVTWGQVTTATMYGTAQDQSAAVIPGAQVTLTNEGTGATRTATTNEAGEFVFSVLQVGSYTLRIEAAGFKAYRSTGIELAASQIDRRPYVLELGEVTETVEVAGAAPLIATASSEQRESLNRNQVSELPLGRRNVTNILKLSSGIDIGGGGVRVNGLGKYGAAITVDGTDANSNPSEGRQIGQYGERNYIDVMSIDAVQEVQVMRGVMQAEFGGANSGQVNLISKSGTNEFHGSAFWLYRSHLFNARNPFQPSLDADGKQIDKNRQVYNQFGGSVGGPIVKNRAFFFGTYEGYRESNFGRVSTGAVPTQKLRDELLLYLPFPETKILLDTLPLPTSPRDEWRGRFEGAGLSTRNDDTVVAKGDVRVTDASNLSVTYNYGNPFGRDPNWYLNSSNDRDYIYNNRRLAVQYTLANPVWVSESRFGYNYGDMDRLDNYFSIIDPNQGESVEWQRRVPRMGIDGIGTWGSAEVWQMGGAAYSAEQKVSRYMGKHSLKFGGRYMRYTGNRTNPENPSYVFNSLDDMRQNIPGRMSLTYGSGGPHKSNMNEFSLFIQDDFRMNSRLTFNLGLRYDYYTRAVVTPTGDVDVFIKNLNAPKSFALWDFGPQRPYDDAIENDGWVNLGPRFGFAYKLDDSGKTILRGGFGTIFAPHTPSLLRASTSNPIVPFRVEPSRQDGLDLGVKYPMYNEETMPIFMDKIEREGTQFFHNTWDPGLQNPYTMNFQFNVQRELVSDMMFEIGWVGLRGVRFPLHRRYNLADRQTGIRPNTGLVPGGYWVDNAESVVYHSLQTSIRKRFSRGFSFDVHYTWGKTLAFGGADAGAYYNSDAEENIQDFNNLEIERGLPAHDQKHRFVVDWIYESPALSDKPAAVRYTLGNWQISGFLSAYSGTPTSINQGCGNAWTCRGDYVGGDFYDRTEVTDGCPVGVHCEVQWINRSSFQAVEEYKGVAVRPGNTAVGLIRTPGQWQVDFSLAKNFGIREGMRFQVRMDMFNLFNHVQLSNPNNNVESGDFGVISGARGMRTMQLGLRLTF